MSRGSELAKNTAIIAFGKISTQFISFFLLPLYTAILSKEEFGTIDVFNTCVALLLPVITLQIEQGAFRFLVDIRDEKKKQQELITSVTAFIALQCIICVVAYMIVAPMIHIDDKIYILLNMIANAFAMTFLQVSRGIGSNVDYSVGAFLTAASSIALNVLFIVGLKMGSTGMLLATFLGNVICCVYLLLRLKLLSFIRPSNFNKDILKRMLKYSLPLVPSAISWWLINASDRLIVAGYFGLDANGILSVAHKFPSVYAAVYSIVNMTWVESATMYMRKEDGEKYFNDMINVLQKLFTSAFLGIVAIMPFVFPFLVNEAYNEAYGLIPIYMLASVTNASVSLISVVYTVDLASKEIAKTTIFAGIINIVAHFILIRYIGLYAAPVSSAMAYCIMMIYRYIDGRKRYRFNFDMKFLGSAVLLFAAICVCYYKRIWWMQGVALIVTIVYCIYVNRKILFNLKSFAKSIVKKQ